MCGIAGVVGPGAHAHRRRVDDMVAALHHRGPDHAGVWAGQDAVLGVARLAIIDVAHGDQPLTDDAAGMVLACNGEIYGHRRLREQYRDHPFRTGSDVEVILAMHRALGDDLLHELPGTFSLALWDERRRSLLLARDRFGERPLYWATTADGSLVFASEVSSLLASGLVQPTVDRRVLAQVLRQGYVPPGSSIWEGIGSLPPGGRLRWVDGSVEVDRWWNPPAVQDDPGEADAIEWFSGALDRAVAEQLEADVAVGAFVSGGIDSSTVAALAARHRPGLDVFCFDMPGDSEVDHARSVADMHGMTLHVCTPTVDDRTLPSMLRELAGVWDEPFGDSSALPTWLLSRFARDHVTVALTGDGADELLGGYLCWARDCLEPDDPARGGPTGAAAPRSTRSSLRSLLRRPRRAPTAAAATGGGTAVVRRYARFREYFDDALVRLGLPAVGLGDVEFDRYGYDDTDDISRFDIDHYLPGDILVKTDRASMAHGLEVRSPFLDVRVAEGCLRLPARYKVDARCEKLLLRRAFPDLLPPSVTDRPKQGFGAPMNAWLRSPGVAELARTMLSEPSSPLFELIDRDATVDLAGGDDQRTWNLLTVALWWERYRPGAGT